jgi:hypothetical protein
MGTAGSTAMCTKGAGNEAPESLQTRMLGYVTAGPRCGQHSQLKAWDSMLQWHQLLEAETTCCVHAVVLVRYRIIWDSGLTCSFLACLIFSFSGLFVKLTGGRVPVLQVCLVRSSTSAGLSFILMWLNKLPWRLYFGKRQNLKLLFARGCCGACAMVSLLAVSSLSSAADSVSGSGHAVDADRSNLQLKACVIV